MHALMIVAAASGCGDLDDVQVPLVPEKPPPRRASVLFPRAPGAPRAFANVSVVPGEGKSCRLDFATLLPPSGARNTNASLGSERIVDGEGAAVQCLVQPRPGAPDVFDVELSLEHDELTRFAVTGALSEGTSSRVAVHVTTPDGSDVEADCTSRVYTLRPGAADFQLAACTGTSSPDPALVGCSISAVAIFENCQR
jgi:hypothetical protein